MKRIILVGAPASGKGTMGRLIRDKYNIPTLSTGDILREEIKKGTELGMIAKSLIDNGNFVPDDLIINIIKNALSPLTNGYLLDGFPRNIEQARVFDAMLKENNKEIDFVFYLDVDKGILINRMNKRLVCPKCGFSYNEESLVPKRKWFCDDCNIELVKRKDDTLEAMSHRLKVYEDVTSPLVDYYKNKNILHVIDGNCDIEAQFEQIENVLG